MYEQSKTHQFNLFNRINQLEQKLTPITTFITNLEKQLAEEDSE